MSRKLLYIILLISFSALSQNIEPRNLFSRVIGENIKSYTTNSKQAYQNNNIERADFLFDSLIHNVVNGSYMDNFKVRKLSGGRTELNDFKKPITSVSWIAENTTGKKVAVANSMFYNMYAQAKPLEANKSSEIEYSTVIRSQQLGLEPIADEDERETIRDNLENRVKKELTKYDDIACRLVRVNFEDGTYQKF